MPAQPTTRRQFLGAAGRFAAAGMVLPLLPRWQPMEAASASALTPVSMAMHVHSSFSEGSASMEAQLDQAARTNVDVLWWSDHDWRMSAYGYRQAVHFDALTEAENGKSWTWVPKSTGSLANSAGGIVSTPASPLDPHPPASMHLAAVSTGDVSASHGFEADTKKSGLNTRTSLAGQRLSIEVFPQSIGTGAYLAVEILTSRRPARDGRRAGQYQLSYRIGGAGTTGSRVRSGTTGIVTLAATPGQWNSVQLDPAADISAIWPGLDGRDASLYRLTLSAVSSGHAPAEGFFDYLRFARDTAGDRPLQVRDELIQGYATSFPSVTQHPALEVSLYSPHLSWFGGALSLPDYTSGGLAGGGGDRIDNEVRAIHAAGGVVSYNHPFGVHSRPALSATDQEAARRRVATNLIQSRGYGADVLEVGYRLREGVELSRYVAVWDACSRNGIFLTGNGCSDNHNGESWATQTWNFVTWALATGRTVPELTGALAAGAVYFGDPRFAGVLDLAVDGVCPMGSVSVSTATTRSLAITATGVPSGGTVRLVQGRVDYAGATVPDPANTVSVFPASDFVTGTKTVVVDTSTSSYVRVVVVDANGLEFAFSNPAWLLRATPAGGIPAARAC